MKEKFNKVLVICYFFPPVAAGGVFRVLKFAKYLNNFGWEPTIITANPVGSWVTDKTLLKQINCDVHSTTSFHPVGLYRSFKDRHPNCPKFLLKLMWFCFEFLPDIFMVPDTRMGWIPFAVLKGYKLSQEKSFDLILTNSPPHSTHAIGFLLSKLTKLPWVVDFKDGWVEDPFRKKRNCLREYIERKLENFIVTNCDHIVTVSHPLKKYFSTITRKHITLIHNGFDEEDFTDACRVKSDGFTIGYFGSIFGDRDPTYFLQALENFANKNKHIKIRVLFVGPIIKEIFDCFKNFTSYEINTVKYVPHSDCIRLMYNCDALLTLVGPDNRNNSVLTGKIFEYLRCGLPIISLCPQNGALWTLLGNFNRIYKCPPTNVNEIENAISKASIDHEHTNLKLLKESLVAYQRKHLTGILAKIMDSCVSVNHK